MLKEVEEKEKEFQGHKKHIEELQRSNEDMLNSCLKDMNEMCDKLIEEIEARRAYLIAELHSKHEAEEEKNKGEMNSIDLSLVRLSDSIRFTRKLLDDGNDVELMTVGMQAKEALGGLSTMAWNRDAVRPSLLRLKFAPVVEDIKSFGKVLNTIQSNDILVENVRQNAYVADELEFSVKLADEIATRKYDATTLLSVTVTHNMRNIPVAIQNNGLNSWSISCTPQDDGEHTIDVKLGQLASQSCKLVIRSNGAIASHQEIAQVPVAWFACLSIPKKHNNCETYSKASKTQTYASTCSSRVTYGVEACHSTAHMPVGIPTDPVCKSVDKECTTKSYYSSSHKQDRDASGTPWKSKSKGIAVVSSDASPSDGYSYHVPCKPAAKQSTSTARGMVAAKMPYPAAASVTYAAPASARKAQH